MAYVKPLLYFLPACLGVDHMAACNHLDIRQGALCAFENRRKFSAVNRPKQIRGGAKARLSSFHARIWTKSMFNFYRTSPQFLPPHHTQSLMHLSTRQLKTSATPKNKGTCKTHFSWMGTSGMWYGITLSQNLLTPRLRKLHKMTIPPDVPCSISKRCRKKRKNPWQA